jgi:hypothetical protein
VRSMSELLRWPAWKRALLALGAHAIYFYERLWGWRRMVTLLPPVRPNALGGDAQVAGVSENLVPSAIGAGSAFPGGRRKA